MEKKQLGIVPETQDIKSYPLLLVGEEWQINNAIASCQGPLREIIHSYTYPLFAELIFKNQFIEKCHFIALFYNEKYINEFFSSINEVKHKTEFILLIEDDNIDFKKVINNWGVDKIVYASDFFSADWSGSSEIIHKIKKIEEKKEIIKKTVEQKKQLDEMIIKQELIVSEKTSDIEYSNKEQDLKLKKERVILRFIKDIALVNSYEDFLRVLKGEFKIFHELGEIFLMQIMGPKKLSILTEKNSYQWRELMAPELEKMDLAALSLKNSKVLSALMANILARPFGKMYLVPLTKEFYLVFENQFQEKSFLDFKEFFDDRNEILFMAMDKLHSELSLNQFSYRWEKTFDAIKEPIAIIDSEYNVLRSNTAFEINSHSLKCYELFAGQVTPCPGCPLSETIEKAHAVKRDMIINKKNYQLFSYPMKMTTDLKSVVHSYRDRTLEKSLYSKLLQTEKLLSIGRLAGHLSHELNNPLTGIKSMVQVLKSQVEPHSPQYMDLLEIEKSAERCFKILNNFMDFSNPKKMKSEPVDISEVVTKTIPLLKVSLRNHSLKLHLNSHRSAILADSNLLQHVIFNLVNNSTQALKEKGEINISSYVNQKKVILEISDTGSGVPDEIQKFIFEPFFTTKPEGEGTGLGLSIVKNIVENTQGKIFYQDNLPHGAKFIIEWPEYENSNH